MPRLKSIQALITSANRVSGSRWMPQAAWQRDQRIAEQVIAAERRVLADCGKPQDRREDVRVGTARLQRQRAVVACLVAGKLRLRAITLRRRLVQRSDINTTRISGLFRSSQVLRIEALARQAAERMDDHRVGEADRQCPRRRRVQREGEIDLVRLQIEHRIAVGGFDIGKLCVEHFGDVLRHVDAGAAPFAGDVMSFWKYGSSPGSAAIRNVLVRRIRSKVLSLAVCACAEANQVTDSSAAAPARDRRPSGVVMVICLPDRRR